MRYTFKLARRTARFRAAVSGALLLSAVACNSDDSTAPVADPTPAPAADVPAVESPTPEMSLSATAPGVAFGDFHLPTSKFRAPYSGALLALFSGSASSTLNAAKNAGLRVVIRAL